MAVYLLPYPASVGSTVACRTEVRKFLVAHHPVEDCATVCVYVRSKWRISSHDRENGGKHPATTSPAAPCCLILDLNRPGNDEEWVLKTVREVGLGTHVAVCAGSTDAQRLKAVAALRPDVLLTKLVIVAHQLDGIYRVRDDAGQVGGPPGERVRPTLERLSPVLCRFPAPGAQSPA